MEPISSIDDPDDLEVVKESESTPSDENEKSQINDDDDVQTVKNDPEQSSEEPTREKSPSKTAEEKPQESKDNESTRVMMTVIRKQSRRSLAGILLALAKQPSTSAAVEKCLAATKLIETEALCDRIKVEMRDAHAQLCKRVTAEQTKEHGPIWFFEFGQAMTPFLARIDTCFYHGATKNVWELLFEVAKHAIYPGDINRLQGSERDNDFFHDQVNMRMRNICEKDASRRKDGFPARKVALEQLIQRMKLRDEEFEEIVEYKDINLGTKDQEREYRAELTGRYYAHRYWNTLEYLDGIESDIKEKLIESSPHRRPTYCQYHDRIEVTSRASSDAYYEWRKTCWLEL